MPPVIHFSDPAPEPVEDRPAVSRAIGVPPLRLTSERYAADDGALSIGDWACEPGAWRIAFADNKEEFFCIRHGRVQLIAENGHAEAFGPGEAAVIPAGFRGVFEVLEAVEKYYVIVTRPG